MKRLNFGRRSNGSFGADISAPGQDADDPNSRKLFSTDGGYMQVLFEGNVAMQLYKQNGGSNGAIPWKYYGVGTFIFPWVLPFSPLVKLASFTTTDNTPEYQVAEGGFGALELQWQYESLRDRVNIFCQKEKTINFTLSNVSVHVSVTSIPWSLN